MPVQESVGVLSGPPDRAHYERPVRSTNHHIFCLFPFAVYRTGPVLCHARDGMNEGVKPEYACRHTCGVETWGHAAGHNQPLPPQTKEKCFMAEPTPEPLWSEPPDLDPVIAGIDMVYPCDKKGLAVIALDDFVGVFVHWLGDRTQPCFGDQCYWCPRKVPRRWRGYFAALLKGASFPCIAQLTPAAARRLRESVPDGEPLRGAQLHLFRESNDRSSPMGLRFYGFVPVTDPLPMPPDVRRFLLHLWGIQSPVAGFPMEDIPTDLPARSDANGRKEE